MYLSCVLCIFCCLFLWFVLFHFSFVILYLVVICIVSGVDKLYGSLTWKSNYCFICTWYYSNTIRFTGKRYFIFIGFVILVYIYLWIMIIIITK
jgi:hypothetical protein